MSDKIKLEYKLFLEAEDVSQARILSTASYMRNILANHSNTYISCATVDDESDMDDFVLRLFVKGCVEEDCANPKMAKWFVDDVTELVAEIACTQSYFDMEGSFSINYGGDALAYTFTSAGGDRDCHFRVLDDI